MNKNDLLQKIADEYEEIISWHELNQFLCDVTPELFKYLSVDGLRYLQREIKEVRKTTTGWNVDGY